MKNRILLAFLVFCTIMNAQQLDSPYQWDWVKDGIWLGAGIAGSTTGLLLIKNKDGIDEATLSTIKKEDISGINRWAAGYSSESANKISDIPFALSFAAPFALLLDDNINSHTGQHVGMYIESLATTAALFSITAGLVNKSRPYVYNENVEVERRTSTTGQRSFYSGHVAAAATATFFAAKVYSDFYPDAEGKFYIWTAAALVPASVGYYRLQAGQHFLTDILIGYALGTATGILVPELHKRKDSAFSLAPKGGRTFLGDNYSALALTFSF